MRSGNLVTRTNDMDELFNRFFDLRTPTWPAGGYEVPTDVFHTDEALVIRMDLPGVNSEDVEVTVQENVLLINGKRRFPYEADKVRFVRRGSFYGEFTQRVSLGKGLNTEQISARYENGVLELRVAYAEEVQPKKISIEVGDKNALSS